MQWRPRRVLGEIEQMIPQQITLLRCPRLVDGLILLQPRVPQIFCRTHPIKLHPGIVPWVLLVGGVEVDLARTDEEPLTGTQLVFMDVPVDSMGVQHSLTADDVVEQIVVPNKRAEGVEGGALLPAILVWLQIQKIFIGKNGVEMGSHGLTRFLPQKQR